MAKFRRGQWVEIPCKVAAGAFTGEKMVEFQSLAGRVSGFVDREELVKIEEGQGFLLAYVEDVNKDAVTIRVHGHFFTTTGIAKFSPEWAVKNIQLAS